MKTNGNLSYIVRYPEDLVERSIGDNISIGFGSVGELKGIRRTSVSFGSFTKQTREGTTTKTHRSTESFEVKILVNEDDGRKFETYLIKTGEEPSFIGRLY